MQRLGELGVRSLESHPPTLEELFLRHYGDELAHERRARGAPRATTGRDDDRDSLTATAPLTRFALRRDRVRIVVWIAAIVLLVVATVGSIKGLYPNQAELDKAARASEDNAAAIIFNGPPQGLDTVGGQVAFQTGTFGLILMGLMSVFMLGRLTRGEEEAGRAELLRSLPVGAALARRRPRWSPSRR